MTRPERYIVLPRRAAPSPAAALPRLLRARGASDGPRLADVVAALAGANVVSDAGSGAVPGAARAPAAAVDTLPAAAGSAALAAMDDAAVAAAPVQVVNWSPADGALLLQPQVPLSLDRLREHLPSGLKVYREQWYGLERPAWPWARRVPRLAGGAAAAPAATAGRRWPVRVLLAGSGRPLSDALVTVFIDEASGAGLEATTDRQGRAVLRLPAGLRRVDAVYVHPLQGGWPLRRADVPVTAAGLAVQVLPIDPDVVDGRGAVYGAPPDAAGAGVRVAVVDTGIGPHRALRVSRGLNTTAGESPRRYRDDQGHGTHVAGLIAATAAGLRRGEACAVDLHAYRIFEAGDGYASTFAIASAIKDAAAQGCDLVNLSIGDSMADEGVRDAVAYAWARGCLCVAATGNDGRGQVDYPARYREALAVTALALVDRWPAGAYLEWTLATPRGRTADGQDCCVAGFSNGGAKVALTAPGVGLVSTLPGDRWGVMSGTSMAAPVATGVIARRLAATPALREAPRDAARAEALRTLAVSAVEDLGLPSHRQGQGLVR